MSKLTLPPTPSLKAKGRGVNSHYIGISLLPLDLRGGDGEGVKITKREGDGEGVKITKRGGDGEGVKITKREGEGEGVKK